MAELLPRTVFEKSEQDEDPPPVGDRGRRDLVSRWDWRLACAAVALVAAVALAVPSFAAAESTEEGGAVLKPVETSPLEALAYWTKARRERAEPLPIVTLPDSTPEASGEEEPKPAPEAESAASPLADAGPRTASIGGTEIKATESTTFPNSANGKVFGVFFRSFVKREVACSGSVVAGNVVVTAGHCVIDPETGEPAAFVIFSPGYNETGEPYEEKWLAAATQYAIPKSWEQTAKPGSYANEGSDVAFLRMASNLERTIGGSLKIDFNQPCNQTYTQWGYPAEAPYGGETLYSHTTPYAGPDTNPYFSPTPMKIASDFTKGASGGPWTVGTDTPPTVLSVTAYGYADQPGYLFGPYFGEAARKAYELAARKTVPVGIEESCKPLEVAVAPAPAPAPPAAQPAPPPVTLHLTRVRRRANGSAVLTARVSTAGKLKLSGAAVRAESVSTQGAGKYKMIVAPKRRTDRKLKRRGKAKVGVKVAFSASGKTRRVSKKIQLSRRAATRPTQRRTAHSH
jgi:V8-like Glu-specific endopeptidase